MIVIAHDYDDVQSNYNDDDDHDNYYYYYYYEYVDVIYLFILH